MRGAGEGRLRRMGKSCGCSWDMLSLTPCSKLRVSGKKSSLRLELIPEVRDYFWTFRLLGLSKERSLIGSICKLRYKWRPPKRTARMPAPPADVAFISCICDSCCCPNCSHTRLYMPMHLRLVVRKEEPTRWPLPKFWAPIVGIYY
jgi:hypothetical protein